MKGLPIDEILRLVQIVVILVSLSANAWFFYQARSDQRIKDIEHRLGVNDAAIAQERSYRVDDVNRMGGRLGSLEEWRKHVPTQDDMDDIRKAVAQIDRAVARVDERSEQTLASTKRIETFMLEKGNR